MSAFEFNPEPYGFGDYDYATGRDQEGLRARQPRRSPSCDCAEPRFDRVQLRFVLATEWCCACSRPSAATLEEFKAEIVANGTRRWIEALSAELGRMVNSLGKAMAALVEPACAFAAAAQAAGVDLGTVQRMVLHGCEVTVKWKLREPPWQACLERWSAGEPWSPWLWVPLEPDRFKEAVHYTHDFGIFEGVRIMAMEGPPLVLDDGEHPEIGASGFEMAYRLGCLAFAGGDIEQLVRAAVTNLPADGLRPRSVLTIVAPRSELDQARSVLGPMCRVPGDGLRMEEVQTYNEARAGLHTAAQLADIDTKLALDTAAERSRRSTLSPTEAIDAERFAIEDRSNRVSPKWAQACLLASRGELGSLEEFGVKVFNREANMVLAVAGAGELEFYVADHEARRFAIDRLTDWFAAQRTRANAALYVPPKAKAAELVRVWRPAVLSDGDVVLAAVDPRNRSHAWYKYSDSENTFYSPLEYIRFLDKPSLAGAAERSPDGEWMTRIAALLEGADEVFVAGEISDQAALTVAHREAGITILRRSAKPWWSERAPSFQRIAAFSPAEHKAALTKSDVVVLFTEAAAYVATSKSDKLHTLPRPSYEDKAMAFMENRPEPAGVERPDQGDGEGECTGVAASWCPIHGDCECPRSEDGDFPDGKNDPYCPLHGTSSTHATALHGGVLDTPKTFTSGIVKDRAGHEWVGWVCGLDFGTCPDKTVISVFVRSGPEASWTLMASETHDPPLAAREALNRTHVLVAEYMRRARDETLPKRLPFTCAPGELDQYPVGQAPGEPEAFSRVLAAMAQPRLHREPQPVEHDPGAALATLR